MQQEGIHRGSTEPMNMEDDDFEPFTQEQLECVAWPESLIALTNEYADYAKEQGEADEEDGPWETIVEAPNGSYFTVSDLVHAIAGLEFEEDCDEGQPTRRAVVYCAYFLYYIVLCTLPAPMYLPQI